MAPFFYRKLFTPFVFVLCFCLPVLQASQSQLPNTESDPDAFIQDCVNVITGSYCEAATDLLITGPDPLILQRFCSDKDAIIGTQPGGWRILPQRFLVIGKDPKGKSVTVGKDRFHTTTAFVGERSGGILPYSGWRAETGLTKDSLKIDVLNRALGMVNTYAKELNGQNNHQNNTLQCNGDTCDLNLGDGTHRIYRKITKMPSLVLGEELIPLMAAQVVNPEYFLLAQEILPSGNHLFYTYDSEGHLTSIEMKSKNLKKLFSWIHFSYVFGKKQCQVFLETSDSKTLTYHLVSKNSAYQLVKVEGSHCVPVSYEYQDVLIKKNLPEGRFIELQYENDKVKAINGPNAQTGASEILHSFSYGDGYTDLFNAAGLKTRYRYDKCLQLTAIERYDDQSSLYRIEQKFWGDIKSNAGLLLAKTIGDGSGRIYSYRSFTYDNSGNVIEERLYGNLTGKQEVALEVSPEGTLLNSDEEECHIKTYGYSKNKFNLLTQMGDCKGNQTLYIYQDGSNRLIKKFIFDKNVIKKRTFHSYNEDGVCIKTIEDDGIEEEESRIHPNYPSERHITEITPKSTLPGIGLPLIIDKKAIDLKTKQEILIKKLVNKYDEQSKILSSAFYDAKNQYVSTEYKTYNMFGQTLSEIDAVGRETNNTYDSVGNLISISIPHENKWINTTYNFHNQPTEVIEQTPNGQSVVCNSYDFLGRKSCITDRYGSSTLFEYDCFNRLTKVIHPEVLDENAQLIRPTFTYTYDLFGNVLSSQDAKGFTTSKFYNLRGDPSRITHPDGSKEIFKYDLEGSLHRILTRDQIITVYEYDYLGRSTYEETSTSCETGVLGLLRCNSHSYNGFHCTYSKDFDVNKYYRYDPAGRLAKITEGTDYQFEGNPECRVTELTYDPIGRIQQKKVWFDLGSQDYSIEHFVYNLLGNLLEKRIEDSEGKILFIKCFSYDVCGQCTEEYSIENGSKTTLLKTSYDAEGEPISYLDALGQETKVIIDHSHQNTIGQTVLKKTVVSSIGVQTEIEFDALGRIRSIVKKDSMGILLSSQSILYDALGNKACEINAQIINGEISDSQKNCWIYGPMGRLEQEIEAAGSSLEKRTSYSYNTLGKMTSKTLQGIAQPIIYTYHKDGRLHKIEGQSYKKDLQVSNCYSYNFKGNIVSASTLDGKLITRSYNSFDQVTRESVNGEGSYILDYSYDRIGRLKEIILPDSSKINYTYDALFGREVKRISAQGELLYSHTYDLYDQQGKLLCETNCGYLGTQEYAYDLNGQKIETKSDHFYEEYTRDALGRVIEVKGERNAQYTYNSLSQLISEKKEKLKTYVYDSLDNRIKVNNEELVHNALNQLKTQLKTEFSYDLQGNLQRKVLDGEETCYESNLLSQLISIEKADKTELKFSYDAFGRLLVEKHLDIKDRNKKTLTTSCYFYIGHQEIGSLIKTGGIETLKIPGLQGAGLSTKSIAFELKGKAYVPIHDVAGNVVRLIDPKDQNVMESYCYTAFGEETIYNSRGKIEKTSLVGNPWRFAEKRVNEKIGLVFF